MGAALVSAVVSTVVSAATVAGFTFSLKTFIGLTATFAALGALSKALIGKPSALNAMIGITQNVRSSAEPRKVVYGRQRVGGTIIWYETKDSTRNNESSLHRHLDTSVTSDNLYLDMIIAVAAHEVDGLEQIFINDKKIFDMADYVDATTNGYVGDWEDHFGFTFYDGSQTSADSDAGHTSSWGTNDKLLGTAYLYCTLKYDSEYYTGIPNISCVIRGKKVYDPRKDDSSTVHDASLGSSHEVDTASTWEFSDNPALILLDYMRDSKYGLGESYSSFDEATVGASADVCATRFNGSEVNVGDFIVGRTYQITLPGGSNFTSIGAADNNIGTIFVATGDGFGIGGSGKARTLVRTYQCNGQINTANPLKQNIENILSSMIGTLQYANGLYYINAYSYKTPHSDTITQDMFLAPLQVTTKTSRRSLYNAVKGRFNSELEDYKVTDYPAITSSTYATNDGETLYLDVDLPFTTNEIAAQRIARLTMKKSRLQQTVTMVCNLKAMTYKVGDNITIDYSRLGWSNKVFEINSLRLMPNTEAGLSVEITAVENDSEAYTWDHTQDQLDFTTSGETSLYAGGTISAPTNVVSYGGLFASGGSVDTGIKIDWTAVDDVFLDYYEVKWKPLYAPESIFAYSRVDGTSFTVHELNELQQYNISVRAVNTRGVTSDWVDTKALTAENREIDAAQILIESGNLDAPTEAEFAEVLGRNPVANDQVIVIKVEDGVATDTRTYLFAPTIKASAVRNPNFQVDIADNINAVLTYNCEVYVDNETVSWSASNIPGSYSSNNGTTDFTSLVVTPSASTKTATVVATLTPANYASNNNSYTYERGLVRISATWDNQTVTKDVTVIVRIRD